MFALTILAAALAAPVPSTPSAPTGAAPVLVELKPNDDGVVTVVVTRRETIKTNPVAPAGAAPRPAVERVVTKKEIVPLKDVKDLKITTATGKAVDLADALEKLKHGAVVAMTSDGKGIDVAYLRVLKEDTLVFVSPELEMGRATGTLRPSTGVIILPGQAIPAMPLVPAAPVPVPIAPPVAPPQPE